MSPWKDIVERAKPAWTELAKDEYRAVWDRFYAQFQFTPSTKSETWPAIAEPADSVAYAIGHIYGAADAYARLTDDLSAKFLKAIRQCCDRDAWVYALDWQHPGYRFAPHSPFEWSSEVDWPVPVLPNGDYFIFLSRAFEFGLFGHPWEETMCIFGSLVSAVQADLPQILDRPVRVGGRTL